METLYFKLVKKFWGRRDFIREEALKGLKEASEIMAAWDAPKEFTRK